MHESGGVEIPAGGMAGLKPGGYHVMIMGLNREIKEGETVTIAQIFKNAGSITIEALVKVIMARRLLFIVILVMILPAAYKFISHYEFHGSVLQGRNARAILFCAPLPVPCA